MISTLSSQVQDVVILHNIALYQLSMPTPRYCSTSKNSTIISITCHLHLAASSSSLSAIVSHQNCFRICNKTYITLRNIFISTKCLWSLGKRLSLGKMSKWQHPPFLVKFKAGLDFPLPAASQSFLGLFIGQRLNIQWLPPYL